ncbi:MAG: CocE/NonD family hydrolase [Rhodobacteraceae bacterium]|nr:MAG: CocE/NonD family hydrolase [Paracoccaceae bacterium]
MTGHGTIEDPIVLRDVMVPMRDGVRLATDITLPAQGGPFPTLLHRTPYDKGGARPSEISVADPVPKTNLQVAEGLARAGYAVMTQDCRGRYGSEGVFAKYMGEGEDGVDTLAWARAQDWCRGDFGTYGLSYSAHVQTALAVLRPPGLRTLFLDSGGFWNAYQGGVRRGGAFEMKQVTWAYKHARLSDAAKDPAVARALAQEDIAAWIEAKSWHRGASPMRHVPEYEEYLFEQWEHGAFDAYWQAPEIFGAGHYAALAQYPTFLISGWYDPYSETMFKHFEGITGNGGHAELVMGPWLHGRRSQSFAGDADFGPHSRLDGAIAPDYDTLRRTWFDHWLKPETARPRPATVQWFAMGGGTGARTAEGRRDLGGLWRCDTHWPPGDTREVAYHLAAEGGLVTDTPAPGAAVFVTDPDTPVPTMGGAITSGEPVMEGGVFDQVTTPETFAARPPFGPIAARGDVLSFATAPLEQAVEIAGTPRLILELATDVVDMDVAFKLIDLAPPSEDFPQGFAANLTDGILRLRYRDSWEKPQLLTPGARVRISLEAPPVANIFAVGHRIRVDICGANFPKFDVNPQTGADAPNATGTRIATTSVFLGAESRVILPLRSP